MTLERATKLKQLGFEWEAMNPNNVSWDTRYAELKAFVVSYSFIPLLRGMCLFVIAVVLVYSGFVVLVEDSWTGNGSS